MWILHVEFYPAHRPSSISADVQAYMTGKPIPPGTPGQLGPFQHRQKAEEAAASLMIGRSDVHSVKIQKQGDEDER